MIKRIFTLLSAIFVGLIAALWIVQNNSQVELALSQKLISKLENMWGIEITKESSRINFFTCSLYLKNGRVNDPKKKNCHWAFKQCKIHISPLSFILKRKINLSISFDNVVATSGFSSGSLDISEHLLAMFAEGISDLNVNLKSIQVSNLDMQVTKDSKKLHMLLFGQFKANKLGARKHKKYSWSGTINVCDAQISLDDKIIAQDIALKSSFYEPRNDDYSWKFTLESQIKDIPPAPKQVYLIQGGWSDACHLFTIKNVDRSMSVKIEKQADLLDIKGFFDLNNFINVINYFYKPTNNFVFESDLSGRCQVDAKLMLDAFNFSPKSRVVISSIGYKGVCGRELALNLMKCDGQEIDLQADLIITSGIQFSGMCSWNSNTGSGFAKIFNSSTIKPLKNEFVNLGLGDYAISSKKLLLTAYLNNKQELSGKYRIAVNNQESDQSFDFVGAYKFDNKSLNVDGTYNLDKYSLNLEMQPKLHFSKIEYQLNDDQIINFRTNNKEDLILNGHLNYSFIKKFLSPSTKNLLLGHDCLFDIKIDQENLGKLHGELSLQKGSFYIPESQNLIQQINSKFEFVFPGSLYLSDVKIGFFKGEVTSPKIAIVFDRNLEVSFLHLPLNFNDLLVNYKKDLLGIIYGNILIKRGAEIGCKAVGQVVLKRSLLKENIFAATDKYNFYGGWNSVLPSIKDLDFDLKLITEQPIKAKTSTLETNAALNLRIIHKVGKGNGIINIPQLTGTVKLDGGFIKVLQNKLMIDYGKIEFVANQMNDPIIDLIAKNRINKYMVSLQASGSLQKPTILVESTPELTEEQVLSLLLSGSDGYKLQTDLLAMVEQNLYNVILGNKKILSESNSLLQKITRPLKYIQISPDFTDQSARGGIKGTININVNDQVKAQIQKNFNLQEDFSAQLEYMLSDDVNVKAIKDQRGELGAEVELRLKF